MYLIRNGEVVPEFVYTIESKPVGMLIFDKQVVIAGMNNTLHSFYLKGKKNFQLLMPCPIIDICKLEVKRTAASSSGIGQCVIVCLANSELRLYNPKDKNLIHILKTEEPVSGLQYGIFGREEGCMILNTKSGGI